MLPVCPVLSACFNFVYLFALKMLRCTTHATKFLLTTLPSCFANGMWNSELVIPFWAVYSHTMYHGLVLMGIRNTHCINGPVYWSKNALVCLLSFLLRCWVRNMSAMIKDWDDRATLNHHLIALLEVDDMDRLERMLQGFQKKWEEQQPKFFAYFQQQYMKLERRSKTVRLQ